MPPTGLRKVRLLKGWGVTALGKKIGVDRSTIYRIEQGLIEPRQRRREALAKALGVPADDLFGRK